jgi:hypothetical protein
VTLDVVVTMRLNTSNIGQAERRAGSSTLASTYIDV